MLKHPIIGLLKTFSYEEKKSLSEFMASPYFVKSRRVKELYREIIKYYPLFSNDDLSKEKLSKELYKGEYKELAIRKLLHELLQIVQNFLAYNKFRSTDYIRDDYILKGLMMRNQKKLFKKYSEKIESEFNNVKSINVEYFYNRLTFESNKINFSLLYAKELQKGKPLNEISNCSMFLTIHFVTEILNEYHLFNIIKSKFNVDNESNYLNKIIDSLNVEEIITNFPKENKFVFILEIYNAMYKSFNNFENDNYYFAYKELVLKHSTSLSINEINVHYFRLMNYCILKNRSQSKRSVFREELMSLYEIVLKNNYYRTDRVRFLSNDLFRDVLFLGLKLRRFKWSYKFVKDNSRKLNPDDIENIYNYGNAYLLNEQKKFELSLDYLNKVTLENFNYKFDEKNLRLRIFFELGYFNQIPGLIHAYYENLRYSKLISKERKNRYRNFLSYFEKIMMYKTRNTKIDISFLKLKIKEEDQILFKEWLLEKIEEIESGVSIKE